MTKFQLCSRFLEQYINLAPSFGFGGLGEIVYKRSYSRLKEDGQNEVWFDTVQRVVEGTYNLQKENVCDWDENVAQQSAQKMFDKIFNFKFLPSGRGLFAMGTPITETKGLFAALNSCAFVSTEDFAQDPITPFLFLFDLSMIGVGVGFDTKGENLVKVKSPMQPNQDYVIEDSREGWCDSLKIFLESYFYGTNEVEFDYSDIRPEGELLKHFGGKSAGLEPLKYMHTSISKILDKRIDKYIRGVDIVDIMNIIGQCVVSGGIRRSSENAICDSTSNYFHEFLDLKDYVINPYREEFGWASNNSIFAEIGMDYSEISQRIENNGEPGVAWLDNMQNYSRMCEAPTYVDALVSGANPCFEQSLESYEVCCLAETFPNNHDSLEEFLETLESAFLYGKSVSLGKIHWDQTNDIVEKNRRIGLSMSGIVQFVSQNGLNEMKEWCEQGYDHICMVDKKISDWMDINESIKKTSIKPSGTISLLAGATAGVHFPESKYYIRRVRFSENSDLLKPLKEAGYHIEPDVTNNRVSVVEFPVSIDEDIRVNKEVSMWEKLEMAAFFQKYWSDNQVSCTVSFDKETEGDQIDRALDIFQYQLKGISFLPYSDEKTYDQIPYEEISKDEYNKMIKDIKPLSLTKIHNEKAKGEKFCTNDTCLF